VAVPGGACGAVARGPLPGGPLAGGAGPGGAGPGGSGPGGAGCWPGAQPWAAAVPSGCSAVTHQRVRGCRAAAAIRSRAVLASSSPNPAASPGVPDWPSSVLSGTVKRSLYAGFSSLSTPADLFGVNELHGGRCRLLVQVTSLCWSDEVGNGRQGCCTLMLYRAGTSSSPSPSSRLRTRENAGEPGPTWRCAGGL
jgi:hypothetical protein